MRLTTSARLPVALERVFEFFSHAENLQALTPDWLHFTVLSPLPIVMGQGTVIDYRIRLHGIPVTWRSEITIWNPPHVFVDTQVRGPYRRWIHTHRFTSTDDGGTLVDDTVDFDVSGGRLVSGFVARDLRRIFAYRHGALCRTLEVPSGPAPPVTITR